MTASHSSAGRCKPGDLAMIVDAEPGASRLDIGRIVRVVRVGRDWSCIGDSRLHWHCNTLGQRMHADFPCPAITDGREPVEYPDEHLRPIRGLGESTNETKTQPLATCTEAAT